MKLEHSGKLGSSILRFFSAVVWLTRPVSAPSVFAQSSGSATLRGTVKDPQGAVVSGASVVLINERTKDERKAISNEEGQYVFSALSPATYTLRVEAQGFKTKEQTGVAVETSSTRGFDVVMEIGQTSEVVNVNAVADQVQTETGAKENTLTAKQIDNL